MSRWGRRYWMARRAASRQALLDEGADGLLDAMAGGVGDVAQGPLPGEYGQPVHRGPDGVLDAVAAPPIEHAGVNQFVERGAQLTQGRAIRPGPAVQGVVGVLPRHGERGSEQPRIVAGGVLYLPSEDRPPGAAGGGGRPPGPAPAAPAPRPRPAAPRRR